MRRIFGLFALALLAACGKQEMLRPATGNSLPQKPLMARETPSAQDLLTPGPQERPVRNAEPVRRSRERSQDPFDLPPG